MPERPFPLATPTAGFTCPRAKTASRPMTDAKTTDMPATDTQQAHAGAQSNAQEGHQPRAAGRRCPRRLHLGRARLHPRGRAPRDRRHFRRIGRRDERGDGRRRARSRRARCRAHPPRRLLAGGEHRRRPAEYPAQAPRAPLHLRAARGLAGRGLGRRAVALLLALRPQSAQHQSAEGRDRAVRRFRGGARFRQAAALHLRDQCADRAPQGFPAREDHRRCGDGVGLPAAAVQGGDDRRRALLGRRLSRQSRRSSPSSTRPIPKTC